MKLFNETGIDCSALLRFVRGGGDRRSVHSVSNKISFLRFSFSSIPSSPFLVAFLYFKSISRSPIGNRHMKVCSSEGSETRLVKLDGLEARYGGGMAKPLYNAIFHFIGA